MDRREARELEHEVRRLLGESGSAAVLMERIDEGLDTAEDPGALGLLLLSRALANQIVGDPAALAPDTLAAASLLREVGEEDAAVFADAFSALLFHRSGDLDRAADMAVQGLAAVERMPAGEEWGSRTGHVLGVLFGELHAFELAARSSEQSLAWDGARNDPQRRLTVEFVRAFYSVRAAESYESGSTERAASVEKVEDSIATLSGIDIDAARLAVNGLRAELAFLAGTTPEPADLESGVALYPAVAPHWVGWHELLRGRVLNGVGRHVDAVDVLSSALEKPWPIGERPTRRELAKALTAIGRAEEAFEQVHMVLESLDDFVRDHVARRAGDLARRVETERQATELRRRSDQLAEEVARDHLTGVASRRALDNYLDQPVDGSAEHAVLLCDLDHFKLVNDAFGHDAGDQVLAGFGAILARHVRSGDVAGRLGGEEFVVVMRADLASADAVAERIRRAIEARTWDEVSDELRVTVSVGLAWGTAPLRDLLRSADVAVYDAKRAGRNRVCKAVTGKEALADGVDPVISLAG